MLKQRLFIALLILDLLAYVYTLIIMVFAGALPLHLQFIYSNLILFPLLTLLVRIHFTLPLTNVIKSNKLLRMYLFISILIILNFIFITLPISLISSISLIYLIATLIFHNILFKNDRLKLMR